MECIKCGVTLCKKNWELVRSKKKPCLKCRHCTHHNVSCFYKYDTEELNIFSKKRASLINTRIWQIKNPKAHKKMSKVQNDRAINSISYSYAKGILTKHHKVPEENITLELIEVKRNQIKLKRCLKQINN